jgi:hypothetical protein
MDIKQAKFMLIPNSLNVAEENVRQKENWQKTKQIWSFWSFVLFS